MEVALRGQLGEKLVADLIREVAEQKSTGLLRLSHDKTGEQTATHRQRKACESYAELRGWTVVKIFEDVDLSAYKSGVTRPCRYEPELQRCYEELALHYGTVILPAVFTIPI